MNVLIGGEKKHLENNEEIAMTCALNVWIW